jgi:F0F1-type ATP synthase membrane subunit b/b'
LDALTNIGVFVLAQAEHAEEEGGGSFLVSPELGLMIWTVLLFGIVMYFLSKTAFPKIGEALEKRAAAVRKNIEAETRRSLETIRKEVADLTVLATEKITRKSLSPEDQQRLVEEALSEVDFSALAGDAAHGSPEHN